MKLRAPGKQPIRLRPVHPSAALKIWYSGQLQRLIDMMAADIVKALTPVYKREVIIDSKAEDAMKASMAKLGKKWNKQFDNMADGIAKGFAKKGAKHVDLGFRESLKKGGFTVEPQFTKLQSKAAPGIVRENVDLIRSIPRQHLAEVRQEVLDSVLKGRDMKELTERLQHRHGVTKRRAQLIARDQNNKATSLLQRVMQGDLGLNRAIWVHTSASAHPRGEHIEFDGKSYNTQVGMWSEEDGEYVWPGTPINCGCTSEVLVPGYDEDEGD